MQYSLNCPSRIYKTSILESPATCRYPSPESSSYRTFALPSVAFSHHLRLIVAAPPCLPRARAAVSPAFVRSVMISRSNSASAPKIWKMSFPPLVVVSMFSVRLLNPMFRLCNSVIRSMRSLRERPRRSRRHTTRVSPPRIYDSTSFSPFRSDFVPLMVSV
jgi:hypothetical protein